MTAKVGPKGQVVIPKPFRDELGLRPGDRVTFTLEERSVRVRPADDPRTLRGRFAGLALVSALEEDRRRERSR